MPAKEIKELRQAGKLEEAYAMAKAELEADLSNIWGKRNLSWVLYSQLDELTSNLDAFIEKINEVKQLDLPASEEMFFENISIVISKAARVITHEAILDINKIHRLFDSIKELPLKRNSNWFSVLFNAMHKGMKESNRYIEFAVVIAQNRKYTTVLLFVDKEKYEVAKRFNNDLTIDEYYSKSDIVNNISTYIQNVNKDLNQWEKIVNFKIITNDISIETGELTPSMKIARNKIEQKYEDIINSMY